MQAESRSMMRRQLDRRLQNFKVLGELGRPQRGWVRVIREALGMTTAQLGKRLSVSQPRVVAMEKAEAKGSITLSMLERAAQAMGCHMVYGLIPHQSLEQLIEERARALAIKKLKIVQHTMLLEAQPVGVEGERDQLNYLIRNLIEKSGSKLWDDVQ